MQTLKGRTCVIIGATAGDGRSIVKQMCMGGMNVVMMTHNVPEAAQSLIDEVRAAGATGMCEAIQERVGKPGEGNGEDDCFKKIAEKYGSIDVLVVNNGDNGVLAEIEDVTVEMLMDSVNHLCSLPYRALRNVLPYLKQSKAPRVIFMTTVEGRRGGTQESFANAVGKGAVLSLALNCAARLAKYGITVNSICKGAIPRVDPRKPNEPDPKDVLPYIPLGRLGTPDDLAEAVCYLASEESAYLTGQVLNVSGGLYMG